MEPMEFEPKRPSSVRKRSSFFTDRVSVISVWNSLPNNIDFYIRQVNVVNGGYTVMLAVLLSFCRSVLLCAHNI